MKNALLAFVFEFGVSTEVFLPILLCLTCSFLLVYLFDMLLIRVCIISAIYKDKKEKRKNVRTIFRKNLLRRIVTQNL